MAAALAAIRSSSAWPPDKTRSKTAQTIYKFAQDNRSLSATSRASFSLAHRLHRGLKGFRRLAPPRSRVAVACVHCDSWNHCGASPQTVLRRGGADFALLRDLRSTEGMKNAGLSHTAGNLVSPHWSLVQAASEFGSVLWDGWGLEWFAWVFRILGRRLAAAHLWHFDYIVFSRNFIEAGISCDALDPHGENFKIQDAGRDTETWPVESQASMVRYRKISRVVADCQEILDNVRAWMEGGLREFGAARIANTALAISFRLLDSASLRKIVRE